jgi:hypothetical protein
MQCNWKAGRKRLIGKRPRVVCCMNPRSSAWWFNGGKQPVTPWAFQQGKRHKKIDMNRSKWKGLSNFVY